MVVSVIDMTVSPEAVFDYTAKCTVTCQWLIMDVVGKEKPRKPCWQSGFRSLLDFTELENGGGGVYRIVCIRYCYLMLYILPLGRICEIYPKIYPFVWRYEFDSQTLHHIEQVSRMSTKAK